jgi:DNA-binding winged helix-turn-helix (wHTH) protein
LGVAEQQNSAEIVAFGVYEANLRTGELRRSGLKVKLQEKPFQVLSILLEKQGDLVTRDELRERLWPSDTFVDFDHGLNTAVNKLREVLGDSASNPRFIETLPRRGYRFIGEVRQDKSTAPQSGQRVDELVAANGIPSARSTPAGRDVELAAEKPPSTALPSAPRALIRTILAAMQLGYLTMYVFALHSFFAHDEHADLMPGFSWLPDVLIWIAIVSVPVRLYLLSAVSFDYPLLPQKFRRLFPFLFILDEIWALAPFWIALKLGLGVTFAAVAAFVYLPFVQRTLMWMGYGEN